MSGISALRAGAGLVTVASPKSAIAEIAAHAPELMTEPLAETPLGSIAPEAQLERIAKGKTVVAMGPGLGSDGAIAQLVANASATFDQPMVLDADALVALPISRPSDALSEPRPSERLYTGPHSPSR